MYVYWYLKKTFTDVTGSTCMLWHTGEMVWQLLFCQCAIFVPPVTTGMFYVSFPSISFHAVSALSQPELNDLLAKRHLYHSTRTELIHIQLKLTY